MLRSVSEETYEQTTGLDAGHAGSAAQDPRARADERPRDQRAPQTGFEHRPAGERRVAVSGAAQARTAWLGQRLLAGHGEQPPRQVLPADPTGRRQLEKAANWDRISTAITRLLDLGTQQVLCPLPVPFGGHSWTSNVGCTCCRFAGGPLARARQLDRDLDDEISYHLEQQVDDLVAHGADREEAWHSPPQLRRRPAGGGLPRRARHGHDRRAPAGRAIRRADPLARRASPPSRRSRSRSGSARTPPSTA